MSNDKEQNLDDRTEDRKVYTYWMSNLNRAGKKMPVDKWDDAENRLKAAKDKFAGEDQRPVVNDFRNHYESSRAYLDQRDPSFKVLASSAFLNDPKILKRVECEKVYLESIWVEQDCQKAESQKLDSALIRNVGFTMPVFDLRKWMPSIKYLPARDVRFDPDCGGLIEKVQWCAYKEDISLEELKADVPELTESDIAQLQKQGGSSLTEEELDNINEDDKPQYTTVTRWHIFAKDAAAIRKFSEETTDEELPDERLADELKLTTKRRYIQLVDGLQHPIKNTDKWPFELDHNELPITHLQMNKEPESLYGFTDYQQMERMDELSDKVMTYVEADAYYASIRKYLGGKGGETPGDLSIDDFLNENKRSYLPDMLDEAGNPLIKEIAVGQLNSGLPQHYELMHDQSKEASGQSELMTESIADLKDVTAIGVRFQEQKLHQRINLRLGGPRGYEKSIQEDAIKILEIAHQLVPRYSLVSSIKDVPVIEDGVELTERTEKQEVIESLPWQDAQKSLMEGGQLLKLGVDAIVGPELAKFWVTIEDVPIEEIRLSMKVKVIPGSTRSITQQQQAAELQDMFIQMLWPMMYEPMGRLDLAKRFIDHIGKLKGIDRMEDFLPQDNEIAQFLAEQKEAQAAEQQAAAQQAEAEQENFQREQAGADAELQRDGAKAEIEMLSAEQKAALEQQKGQMQLAQMKEKQKDRQRANV